MKKRLLSILLMCCMVLTLLPTAAFAEGSTEELPVCTCETACTVESMNDDCPVCGAEGASAENCAKYVKPADDVPTQSENEPVVLNSEDTAETVTWTNITKDNTDQLKTSGYYKLTENIDNLNALDIGPMSAGANITLDLNGHTLTGAEGSYYTLWINQNTMLTIIDSSTSGSGQVISPEGTAIYVYSKGSLILNTGALSGKAAGVVVDGNGATFTMNGGSVTGGIAAGSNSQMELNNGTVDGIYLNNSSTLYANGGTVTGLSMLYGTVRQKDNTAGTVFNGLVVNATGKEIPGTLNGGTVTGNGYTTPFLISNAEGLKWFRDYVNSAADGSPNPYVLCATLTADIDLDGDAWTPIAPKTVTYDGKTYGYCGIFDGGGHTISGLNVSGESGFSGLFGVVTHNGTIKNLTVAGKVSSTMPQCYAGGIVGKASGTATIENCSNHCSVSGGDTSFIGGIAGFNDSDAKIIDCYNVGTISSERTPQVNGGIVGSNSGTISNCYNVGKVSDGDRVGEIVGDKSGTIGNCYYLSNTSNGEARTEAEFADGTVLALLKAGDRGSNADPWDSACKYVTAAGKTLPVFKGQGDAHEHSGAWTSNGDGTHTRTCVCGVTETAKCSGGTATCTAKAKCADCGAEYGDTNPNHHGDKLKHVEAKDATFAAEGNIEYWHCEACGKYFSDADAKNEITQAQTVIPKRQSSSSSYSYYTIKGTAGAGGSISPSGNVSVREGRDQTFTITPDKGYAVSNVKIDGKSIGAVKSYTFENVNRTHTIEVIFMKANGNPQTGVFVDVATGSYYEDAVNWAVENGITQGTDDTHFSPDGICTRAQAVTFLWRAAGSPESETRTMPFTDVPAGSYYYDAVLWAAENGITEGTSDTAFSPDATCSRAQIVTFLWRFEKSPAAGTANPFADVKSTAYYADAVLWAVKEDITKGTTNTTFSPDADCTRAQIVTFLWRCKK